MFDRKDQLVIVCSRVLSANRHEENDTLGI